jgi:hypothetical protein
MKSVSASVNSTELSAHVSVVVFLDGIDTGLSAGNGGITAVYSERCWNWQTGMVEGYVPQGVRVQVPPSALPVDAGPV